MVEELKKNISKKLKFPSELRFDLISGNWVVIATGRARRPETFKKKEEIARESSRDKCPFCKITGKEKAVLIYNKGEKLSSKRIPKNWTTIVVPNKYPAFLPFDRLEKKREGKFYQTMNAVGFCEVLVTKDHKKAMGQFDLKEVKEVIEAYQDRYSDLAKKPFVNYISIFHNHGIEAGATIAHPHSQIITTPLIDVDLKRALANSKRYSSKEKKCIYCQMNNWEKRSKKRVIFENKKFLAICPFASNSAFQVIISPKSHLPYFEMATNDEKWQLSEAFQVVLRKLYKGLNNPAYNFYLHTAPADGKKYPYYHWHWTILPKTSIWAGFELGVGMEISTIEPERAAEYLRKQK